MEFSLVSRHRFALFIVIAVAFQKRKMRGLKIAQGIFKEIRIVGFEDELPVLFQHFLIAASEARICQTALVRPLLRPRIGEMQVDQIDAIFIKKLFDIHRIGKDDLEIL